MPEIKVVEVPAPLHAEFLQLHPNPAVPSAGDNAALLDWAQACAINNRQYEQQIKAIKESQ